MCRRFGVLSSTPSYLEFKNGFHQPVYVNPGAMTSSKREMQSYSKAPECIRHVPFLAFSLKEYLEILSIKFHHSIFGVHRSVFVNHGAMTSYSKALKCIIHVPSFPRPCCRNILSYLQILFCCRINRGSSYSSWTPNFYHYLIQMHRWLGI